MKTLMALNPALTAALAAAASVYLAYTTNKAAYDDYIQRRKTGKEIKAERTSLQDRVNNLSPEKRAQFDALQARHGGTVMSGAQSAIGANAGDIMRTFQRMGYSAAQAAGLASNIVSESGGRANAIGDGGNAYGIGQWHKGRQDDFKTFSGHDIHGSSLQEQLAFVDYELHNKERNALKHLQAANTAYDAGAAVSQFYERPAAVQEAANNRGNTATNIMAQYGQQQRMNGQVGVQVAFNNPPAGMSAVAKASGDILGPPVVNMGMPLNTF